MADQLDDDEIRNCIRDTFVKYIIPGNVLPWFHKYDIKVLTQHDIQRVNARVGTHGDMDGAQWLLDFLPRYKNWFPCLIKVLQDEQVKLDHVAESMISQVDKHRAAGENLHAGATTEQARNTSVSLPNTSTMTSSTALATATLESKNTKCAKEHKKITKMAVTESRNLTLLLVGRTGNGKSSTGNSIIGRKAFTPRGRNAAVTAEILKETADINGHEITVVDGPGIGNASFDNYNDINVTLTQAKNALDLCPNGFSALLIVLKYNIRFTQQEKDTITMIKSIFGRDVVRKYGVIVMSHGDSFEVRAEAEEMSFEDWCKKQTGDIKTLFTECDYRCVLFNNRTKDLEQLKAQLDSLMSKVTCICFQVENYTPEHYKEAEGERTKMLVKSKLPQIEKETDEVFNEIRDQLDRDNYTKNESLEMLNACSAKITKLKSDLQNEDKSTGCTKELQTRVALLETKSQLKLKSIQAQTSEHAEVVNNQNEGNSVFGKIRATMIYFKKVFVE